MSYFLDKSAVEVVQNIAQKAAQPNKSLRPRLSNPPALLVQAVSSAITDAFNTIWGVKVKPGGGILHSSVTLPLSRWWEVFVSCLYFTMESVPGVSHYAGGVAGGS
jgi:hypothetical protein